MSTSMTPESLDPVKALEQVLRQQIEMYEQYEGHLRADQELMSKLKIAELEQNNKMKNTLVLKLQAMDQARQALVKQVAAQYKISEEVVTIRDICKVLSTEVSDRLLALRERLLTIMQSLKGLQEQTTTLANASMQWVNGSMATLKKLLTPTGTYNIQGQVDHPSVFSGRNVERRA